MSERQAAVGDLGRLRKVAEAAIWNGVGAWIDFDDAIQDLDPPTVLALLDRLEAAEARVARTEALASKWETTPALRRGTMARDLRAALSDEAQR